MHERVVHVQELWIEDVHAAGRFEGEFDPRVAPREAVGNLGGECRAICFVGGDHRQQPV